MTDTHAHLYSDKLKGEVDEIVATCLATGVRKIYMPNIDSQSVEAMHHLAEKYPETCIPMMGLHPCSVNAEYRDELRQVERLLAERPYAAVGEMGLDLYWDKSFYKQQLEAFKIQAHWAKELGLPLVVHTRNAMSETIALLRELAEPGLKGVVHCFTGTAEEAEAIMETGFLLGIGGIVTYKNGGLDKVLPRIGLSSVILETDSPYLAPVPHRGKPNKPTYIPIIAQKIADLLAIPLQEVANITDQNAQQLFTKASD